MKWPKCLLALFVLSAAQIANTGVAHASSDYDDFFPAQSTTTLVNHISNYYSMACGTAEDDYASMWSEAIHTDEAFNSGMAHENAMTSLDAAISDGGGVWIQYDQVNNNDDTSTAQLVTVYWAEDASQWEQVFTTSGGERYFTLQRKAGVPSTVTLQYGVIGSTKLLQHSGYGCEVEWIWGGADYIAHTASIVKGGASKLFLSTFDVTYPSGYNGATVPSQYVPVAIHAYDELLQVAPALEVYTDGAAKTQTMDISTTWWSDFKQTYAKRVAQNIGWPTNFVTEFEDIMESGGSWGVYMVEGQYGRDITIVGTHDPNAQCGFKGPASSGTYRCTSGAGYGFVFASYFTHNSFGGNGCTGSYGDRCSDNGMNIYTSPTVVQSGTTPYTFLSIPNASLADHKFFFLNFDLSYPYGYDGESIPSIYTPPAPVTTPHYGTVDCMDPAKQPAYMYITQAGNNGYATLTYSSPAVANWSYDLASTPYQITVGCGTTLAASFGSVSPATASEDWICDIYSNPAECQTS